MRFEQIEALIRREAHGTSFGRDFEWLCKWYLEHAPLYRGKFRKVWRWDEWPDRWGRDCGIDLIAETIDAELWAVQCKAVSPEHAVAKAGGRFNNLRSITDCAGKQDPTDSTVHDHEHNGRSTRQPVAQQ